MPEAIARRVVLDASRTLLPHILTLNNTNTHDIVSSSPNGLRRAAQFRKESSELYQVFA